MTPLWFKIALQFLGVREAPGAANSNVIMGWAKAVGGAILGIVYPGDATPWCGLFVANAIRAAGLMPPKIAVRAKAWATWGVPCRPCEGAILVFERPGGGHVGFYAGENETKYLVLGGNQGDAVSKAWFDKTRCIAVRWPDLAIPRGRVVRLAGDGPSSRNEA